MTEGCTSPVGMCFEGQLSGGIKGTARATVSALQEGGAPGVYFLKVESRDTTKDGTLHLLDSAAQNFSPSGQGEFVNLTEIVEGTGALSGATGHLRIQGTTGPDGISLGKYEGTITLP